MSNIILHAIKWYQSAGGARHFFNIECNFEPSCSEYTHQAITKYGTIRGIQLGISRIRRCNDPDCPHTIIDHVP